MLSKLSKLSEEYNVYYVDETQSIVLTFLSLVDRRPHDEPSAVWVLVVSHVAFEHFTTIILADPGATMTFVAGGALKPIGGHIISHASTTRMFLRKGQ